MVNFGKFEVVKSAQEKLEVQEFLNNRRRI